MSEIILDVRKLNLTNSTLTMGTLFKMNGLIESYENFRDLTGFLPTKIIMKQIQYDAYRKQLESMAMALGLSIGVGEIFFRGTKVEINNE